VDSLGSPAIHVARLSICWTSPTASDSRYLLFLWQLGRRRACWPVHHTCWFFGHCLACRCTCLCGSVANVWFYISVCDSDIPGHWLASGPWDQCAAVWAFPILHNQIRQFLCCRNLCPFHIYPQNVIHGAVSLLPRWHFTAGDQCSPHALTGFPQVQACGWHAIQPLCANAHRTASSDSLRLIEAIFIIIKLLLRDK